MEEVVTIVDTFREDAKEEFPIISGITHNIELLFLNGHIEQSGGYVYKVSDMETARQYIRYFDFDFGPKFQAKNPVPIQDNRINEEYKKLDNVDWTKPVYMKVNIYKR